MSTNLKRTVSAALLVLIATIALFACPLTDCRAQGDSSVSDAARIKSHVREVLGQPEFNPVHAAGPMDRLVRAINAQWERFANWWNERWHAFLRWLDKTFRLSGPGPSGAGMAGMVALSAVAKVLMFVLICLGAWFVAWLCRGLILNIGSRRAKARTAYDEGEPDDNLVLEPGAWMNQASTYADSDDYRRAFRAVFVATLLLLDAGGLIEFDRSRTNGDYLRILRRKAVPRIYLIMDPLVIEFDRRWYGRAETHREDYLRIQKIHQQVRELIAEPAPGAAKTPVLSKG